MTKFMGYSNGDFVAKDGTRVEGFNIFVSKDIPADKGKGVEMERLYLSIGKITKMGIDLDALIGKPVRILYNRYGKIEAIEGESR